MKQLGYIFAACVVLLAVAIGLDWYRGPKTMSKENLAQNVATILNESAKNDANKAEKSWANEFRFLRKNQQDILSHDILREGDLTVLYRHLTRLDALWQLRVITRDLNVPGGVGYGDLPSVCAALDSAQAYGTFLHEVIKAASELGVSHRRILAAMDDEYNEHYAWREDEYSNRLRDYIGAVAAVGWVNLPDSLPQVEKEVPPSAAPTF